MHLVQILLPLYDNEGARQPAAPFAELRRELTERFGGLTAYTRAPAEGLWQERPGGGEATRDEIVIYEVMAEAIDADWWRGCRERLERALRQETIVIRAQELRLL